MDLGGGKVPCSDNEGEEVKYSSMPPSSSKNKCYAKRQRKERKHEGTGGGAVMKAKEEKGLRWGGY